MRAKYGPQPLSTYVFAKLTPTYPDSDTPVAENSQNSYARTAMSLWARSLLNKLIATQTQVFEVSQLLHEA